MKFQNRKEAGRKLAEVLVKYKNENPIVLAVPRGGVETGFEVAAVLEAPLDIIIARKLGAPGQPELAMGAVVNGDNPQTILNQNVMISFGVTDDYLEQVVKSELAEIDRRQRLYRMGHPPVSLVEKSVILVDDGIATGASIRAAIRGLRRKPLKRLILAVPVAPPETAQLLQMEVDDLICLSATVSFMSVGSYYEEFKQTSDEKVIELLDRARAWTTQR